MTNFYEIRIDGYLDAQWTDWFDGMSITQEAEGTTLLSGPVVDQPTLYGLLHKVRDLGLRLLSVKLRTAGTSQLNSNEKRIFMMNNNTSQRTAALTAGLSLLVMFVAAMFANFFVVEGMVVPDNAATTTNNILTNFPLFRSGIVAFLVVLICDVLAAWGLYVYFEPANRSLSVLAGWFRLVYTAIFGAAIFGLVSILRLLGDTQLTSMFDATQLQSQVMLYFNNFDSAWVFSLIFFAIHLFVLGYLIVRFGHGPKWIGILLILAALGYLTDSSAQLLMENYADYQSVFLPIVAIPGILGELSLCFWLLFKGGKEK